MTTLGWVVAGLALMLGFAAGIAYYAVATWAKTYRMDSEVRALRIDVGVAMDMGEEIPPEWFYDRLTEVVNSPAFR